MIRTAIAVAALFAATTPLQAQQIAGGEITLGYSSFTGDLSDANASLIQTSAEVDFSRNLGMQVDLSRTHFNEYDFNGTSYVFHGLYHLSETSTAGLFFGNETIDGEDSNFFGLEAGTEYRALAVEGYYAKPTASSVNGYTVYGVFGKVAIDDSFDITARYDSIDSGMDLSASRLSLGAQVKLGGGFALYAETGNASFNTSSGDLGETFYGIGATYRFGTARGATFRNRNVSQLIPGL
ncbi:MAG: hypothetical protein GC146_12480 [Limimaricola sp.]|uniref:hypothetical protein n=1 Tax=Limimaricola sp. TaxID=2211665 RepID=UPI001D72A828|nr:hypothetical protein [Limimaricola sp.]MBI1418030.1 hypothetical protein [Limimaricola sp.]